MQWAQATTLPPHQYICGHCGDKVASKEGYVTSDITEGARGFLYLCAGCSKPTFFHRASQIPGVIPGVEVGHLPVDIAALYREARQAAAGEAHTASVLACRKLLMNIAVAQGAKPGETFLNYVEHLANAGFVPPNGKGWVDHIRKKGNEATHEIQLMGPTESSELISFSEMLLKFIYEFPAQVPAGP